MARTIERLTALKVNKAKQPGMYADGSGLYLRVTEDGTKNWVFRFMLNGRPRWMGMGPLHTIGLADARARAAECRRQRHDGIDPIDARRAQRQQGRLDAAKTITFKECAASYITAHKVGWRNDKHAAQWKATLATYAGPVMGKLSVQAIDTALVLKVIEPLWTTKPETAGRLRSRIESILDWAKVRGYREGENPARWRGHLDHLLPATSKVRKVEHHAALPDAALPSYLTGLQPAPAAAARSSPVRSWCASMNGPKGIDPIAAATQALVKELRKAYREKDRAKRPVHDPQIESWLRHSIALRRTCDFLATIGTGQDVIDNVASISAAFLDMTRGLHPPLFKPISPGGGRKNDQYDVWAARAAVVTAWLSFFASGKRKAAHLIAEIVDGVEDYRPILRLVRSGAALESAISNWHKLLKDDSAGYVARVAYRRLVEDWGLKILTAGGEPTKEQYRDWALGYLREAASYARVVQTNREGKEPEIFKRAGK